MRVAAVPVPVDFDELFKRIAAAADKTKSQKRQHFHHDNVGKNLHIKVERIHAHCAGGDRQHTGSGKGRKLPQGQAEEKLFMVFGDFGVDFG